MKRRRVYAMAAGWMLGLFVCAGAQLQAQEAKQDRGLWQPASRTAEQFTGDIGISELKLSISFSRFTIAQIRELTPAEAGAVFGADGSARAGGNLYRVDIPGEKKFAHHNTLCGGEDTQWMATWSDGRTLQVAFFSGSAMPVLTEQALAQSQSVCELLAYER